ncbi:FtsX-like permease family protein [Kribbella sp. NPDC005582]|uniref:FtsX-like permease family protein n=1 Tax=Kribbella sp. NPDC005582 TaxID=3156893 RepID=UPI00339E42DD
MGSWGPPLRIARRTTRKHLGRTFLVAALIGLPVFAATWAGVTGRTGSPTGELLARTTIGQADAQLTVTPYDKLDLSYGEPRADVMPAQASDSRQVRTPATFDPKPLLPAGTVLARPFSSAGSAEVKGPSTVNSVDVVVGDGQSPLLGETVRLDQGRFATAPDEVAISPDLADHLGIAAPGATLNTANGKAYKVVGIARQNQQLSHWLIFATPASTLVGTPPLEARYLLDLPDRIDPRSLTGALGEQGLFLLPRANIIDPPPGPYNYPQNSAGPYAVMALAIGFGVLEIVLLAGTAFAVGARRQTRELGLILAAGGTARDVRRIVLLQGVFAGVVGVGGGLLLAAVALTVSRYGWWEHASTSFFVEWQIPWTAIVTISLIGLLSGLAAAVVPAISAGRQTPLAALSGRFAATATRSPIRKPALLLVIAGVVLVVTGSGMIAAALAQAKRQIVESSGEHATVTPEGPIALVLLGITLAIAGLIWMLPSLVSTVSGLAGRLPLSGRLAMRDAARHRHRTAPAAAAIMMSVAATAAAAFAGANSVAANAAGYVPEARMGNATLRFDSGPSSVPFSPELEQRVAEQLPTEQTYRFGMLYSPRPNRDPAYVGIEPPAVDAGKSPETFAGLVVVDPSYIEQFDGNGRELAARLRAGDIVVPRKDFTSTGTVGLGGLDPDQPAKPVQHKASYGGELPLIQGLRGQGLIGLEAAAKLGQVSTFMVEYRLQREPTDDELAAVDRVLGHDGLLKVERGYQNPSGTILLWILIAAAVVTLLGVAISVSLSAAEGRADLATLAAVGASPRRRRNLAAAQAWFLGQLGCVLGVGVGALYGYTAHAAFGSPHFTVPWAEIGGTLIVVPAFAAALAWLLTRSRLPMVARID